MSHTQFCVLVAFPVRGETAETTGGVVIFKDKDGKETGRFKNIEVQCWSIEGQ
jgi:hypothetical protein